MNDIRKILVPVDFSENSRTALDCAAAVARQTGAGLDVIHVWQMPSFLPPDMLVVAEQHVALGTLLQKNAELELSKLVTLAAERGITISERRVTMGVASEVIVEVAKAEAYDLIVMATHGRSGLSHALLGSVAERVVRHAPRPVLTVRGNTDAEKASFPPLAEA